MDELFRLTDDEKLDDEGTVGKEDDGIELVLFKLNEDETDETDEMLCPVLLEVDDEYTFDEYGVDDAVLFRLNEGDCEENDDDTVENELEGTELVLFSLKLETELDEIGETEYVDEL